MKPAATTEHVDMAENPKLATDAKPADHVLLDSGELVARELVRSMTPDERATAEKALCRKIDFRLLPMIILMYILNYLDRTNIAAARLAGLTADLNLSSVQFSTSVSILFAGYIFMQIPSNIFLDRIGKPAIYLPTCMVLWGIISTATAACQSFAGLIVCRFMLGFVEAAYFPGCFYFLSCWYTRQQLSLRVALLTSGSLLSGAFGGLFAAGITGSMDGVQGLRAWRWLFIIEGILTICVAVAAYFVLPNFPATTKWLTEEERQLAQWRLEEDIGQPDSMGTQKHSFLHGLKLAVTDVKVYVMILMTIFSVGSGSVTNFFPTVVATLGYNNVISLLLTAPPYILCVICALINAWHADRTRERYWHSTIPLYVLIVACIIAVSTTATAPRYFAMMLMIPGIYTGFVVLLGWIPSTIPRPPAKRAAALALINSCSNTSAIWGSYLYPVSDAPRFVTAFVISMVMALLVIAMCTLLRFILIRINKKLDRGVAGEHVLQEISLGNGLGEGVSHGFRYIY